MERACEDLSRWTENDESNPPYQRDFQRWHLQYSAGELPNWLEAASSMRQGGNPSYHRRVAVDRAVTPVRETSPVGRARH